MPPVSSTKCYTGHTTSASGSIEAVISLLAMKHGFVPANLGWNNPMPEGIIPSMGLKNCEINHVLCNSFGFGGNDSSLIFSRFAVTDKENAPKSNIGDITVLAQVEITDESELEGIRNYVKPLEARRMGKIMKSSLLSSLKALEIAGIDTPDAIITATAWGCLDYSERLLKQLQEEGEALLKPTYFMQSTHNTIGSNIAIRLKCHGYNVTYTHGEKSLDWAIRDAKLLIQSGKYKTVLVGVHDEVTPMMRSLMERLGIKVMPSSFYSKAIVMSCGR
jgi:3-oxoacyl-(acyl-carrier-protein) synthase